jgi:transposase
VVAEQGQETSKNGKRYLAWAYIEAASFAIRFCEPARKFYQHKKAKRNGIVAIKAVAHKLARACFRMLETGEEFSVERCFT